MGSDIKVEGNTAIITGVDRYTGAEIAAPDLRAGAALVIGALCAEGESVVTDVKYIQRGYEDFHLKLAKLGGKIIMVDEPDSPEDMTDPAFRVVCS
jgi:UDP-N-acetylglucosamine 1-carboxyvinyltransferase